MRVTRLEIFGFKSFVERFVLNFDKNMVGIVGPNGCGKSNIVDALRWVLGETHAKQLRGTVLDDLIFNGSDSRRPLGMAEVSITIRPDEGWEAAKPIRLEDLKADSEADESVDSPEEELDEALLSEGGALEDIPGLFDSAEVQLTRRLYRSGESEYFINRVPCRLRDMVELFRLIGLGSRGLSIVQQGQIGEIISKKPVERRELLEEAAGISGFRARMEAAQRKLDRTSENMARLADIIIEVEKQVRVLKRQANRAKNRNELKESLKEAELSLFAARSLKILKERDKHSFRATEVAREVEDQKNRFSLVSANQEAQRSRLEECDVKLSDLRRETDQLSQQISEQRDREQKIRIDLVTVEEKIRTNDNVSQKNVSRVEAITAEKQLSLADISKKEADLAELRSRQEQFELHLSSIQRNAGDGQLSATAARRAFEETQTAFNEKRLQLSSIEAEIRSLEEQLNALAEQLWNETSEDSEAKNRGEVFLSGLEVEEVFQKAVTAALGERAYYIVADGALGLARERSALRSSGQAAELRLGVIEREVVDLAENRPLDAEELGLAPSIRPILSAISVKPGFEKASRALLGSVYLCDSFAEAIAVNEYNRRGARPLRVIATLSGEVVTPWGWFSNEGKGAGVSFARRIQERKQQSQVLREEIEKISEELARSRAELDTLERRESDQFESLLANEREAQEQVREVTARVAALAGEVDFERRRMTERESELGEITRHNEQLLVNARQLSEEKQGLENSLREASLGGPEELRVHRAEERFNAVMSEVRQVEKQRDEVRQEHALVSQEFDKLRRRIDFLTKEDGELRIALERSELELSMMLENIQRFYPEVDSYPSESERQSIESKANENLDTFVEQMEEEANRLRRRLEREGEVDPQAIELFETEEQRLASMREQYTDLQSASEILDRTIKRLKEISRIRFLETYDAVREKFTELVPRLFGGGSGVIELINPEDPLTSGIELSVRPPGKKLSNMELLSGGEKALVATALIIAMFLHRPSPICVLDEVDAPLDDANLERFLSLISEISAKTQFLIITHNKQTMGAVDRLLGITMQERGVSTALSVTLEQAEQELEQWVVNAA